MMQQMVLPRDDVRRAPKSGSASRLSATRSFDSVRVQIVFHDEFNMLERLAPFSVYLIWHYVRSY